MDAITALFLSIFFVGIFLGVLHTCVSVDAFNRTHRNSTVLTEVSARDDVEQED